MKPALLFLFLLGFAGTGLAADEDADSPKLQTRDRMILILGSYADFKEARTHGLAISHASGAPFSLEGKIFDKKRGLILPDNDPDTIYAGSYILRRNNTAQLSGHGEETEYISIERSDAYPGLKPGYYVLVGGIYESSREANKALSRFKPAAADAYVKKTQIYMGCMH